MFTEESQMNGNTAKANANDESLYYVAGSRWCARKIAARSR